MTGSELRKKLESRISPEEKEMLRSSDPGLDISDFNRSVCMRIIEPEEDFDCDQAEIDESAADELESSLKEFLSEYMADRPEAHKWIVLSCLELTFVERRPMHPQSSASWVFRDGKYLCPSMNRDSIICSYCACEEAESDSKETSSSGGDRMACEASSSGGMACEASSGGMVCCSKDKQN